MKSLKFIFTVLFIGSSILFSFNLSFAQKNCNLAYPMMEVLKCEKSDKFTQNIYFSCSGSSCSANYICVSDCTLNLHIECGPVSRLEGKVLVKGEIRKTFDLLGITSTNIDLSDIEAGDGESIVINANCERLFFDQPIDTSKSYAVITDYQKYLFATNHEWSSHQLYETKDCIPQNRVANFINKQIKSGTLPSVYSTGGTDILGNSITSYEGFTDISNLNLASELKVGNTISYFYRWEVVSNINLKYDENKNPVYCGGSSDQRKLIGYNTITTNEGCYYVPSTVLKLVECCLDGDCRFTGQLCGPGFVCTDKKPCNGVYDCGTEEPQCTNNQKSWWTCDTSQGPVNMPNGITYNGWCKKETQQVKCCPSSCQTGYHCVEDTGCEPDIRIIECPSGKCCESGGNYRPKSCSSGYQCCHYGDSIVGECKQTCQPTTIITQQNVPSGTGALIASEGFPTGMFTSASSIIAGIIITVIIIVVVWKKGYLHFERGIKTTTPVKEVKPIVKEKPKTDVIFCTQCGSEQTKGTKFCTNCGNKLK